MNTIGSNNLLAMRKAIIEQNDALQKAAKPLQDSGAQQTGATSFGAHMKNAIEQVNELQQDSAVARSDDGYRRGHAGQTKGVHRF